MRIIYVTASLPFGTQEAFIIAEVNALVRLGHDVLVVPRSPRGQLVHADELRAETLPESLVSRQVLRRAVGLFATSPGRVMGPAGCVFQSRSTAMALKNMAVVPKALWLATIAKRWRADHIHCHWAATTATMAMVASNLSGVPWSFTAHRWDIVENNLLAMKAQQASFVRVISNETMKMAAALGVKDKGDLRVLRMGVEMPQRAAWKKPPTPVVLCPANLVEVKGHKYLLAAWRMLQDRGVQGELWLAGSGELEQPLKTLIRELNLEENVKLLGALPHTALLHLYERNSVSAVVLASIDMGNGCHEGIPVALIEAMSYGIPVVSTRTGAIAELVLPGTGLLVSAHDSVALADAILQFLEDDKFAEQAGHAGRLRVAQTHDIVSIAAALQDSFAAATLRASAA